MAERNNSLESKSQGKKGFRALIKLEHLTGAALLGRSFVDEDSEGSNTKVMELTAKRMKKTADFFRGIACSFGIQRK